MQRKKIVPSQRVEIWLPEPLLEQLKAHLYSELERRVPQGAYQAFFSARLREYFSTAEFDLAPFAASMPGDYTVRGSPAAVAALERTLKGEIPL
jgi:hypothetical protein